MNSFWTRSRAGDTTMQVKLYVMHCAGCRMRKRSRVEQSQISLRRKSKIYALACNRVLKKSDGAKGPTMKARRDWSAFWEECAAVRFGSSRLNDVEEPGVSGKIHTITKGGERPRRHLEVCCQRQCPACRPAP